MTVLAAAAAAENALKPHPLQIISRAFVVILRSAATKDLLCLCGCPALRFQGSGLRRACSCAAVAVCCLDFLRGDLVVEAIGVEAVEAAVGRFRLGVHQESNRRAA